MTGPRTESLLERLGAGEERVREFRRQTSVAVPRDSLAEAAARAREEGFEMLSDVLGIDWLEYPRHQGPRFSVVYNLYAPTHHERVFLRVAVDEGESVPTVTHLWRGADFMEREVFDMFGIAFEGHPNLRKLLTPEDLDAHPHRKDFPLGETPTLFKDGRFLDPASFRAGMIGRDPGLTGWSGGARRGVRSDPAFDEEGAEPEGGSS